MYAFKKKQHFSGPGAKREGAERGRKEARAEWPYDVFNRWAKRVVTFEDGLDTREHPLTSPWPNPPPRSVWPASSVAGRLHIPGERPAERECYIERAFPPPNTVWSLPKLVTNCGPSGADWVLPPPHVVWQPPEHPSGVRATNTESPRVDSVQMEDVTKPVIPSSIWLWPWPVARGGSIELASTPNMQTLESELDDFTLESYSSVWFWPQPLASGGGEAGRL